MTTLERINDEKHSLERLVLDILVIPEESGFDLLFGDLTKSAGMTGCGGFKLHEWSEP